jgi:two-component system sensor histidine kinase KdpD
MRLVVAVPDDLPPLCTDQRRLHQALSNFVDNAIKYSPEGSEVTLEARSTNDNIHLRVCDEGPGIPQGELKRIFEEFYRCRNRVNDTANRGAGLGLAIVARIADMLGAKVTVESAPSAGSTFSLIFPAGAVQV